MGSTNISQPAQPSYGEGLSEALQAQVGLLTGTGDFASTGSLESLLPLEESIRKKTAQADTDILRQTLLGGEDAEYTQDGRILEGYDYVADGESKTGFSIEPIINVSSKENKIGGSAVAPIPYPGGLTGEVGFILKDLDGNEVKRSVETIDTTYNSPQEAQAGMEANKDPKNLLKQAHQVTRNEFKEFLTESQITEAFNAEDLSSLQFTDRGDTENATPRFKKNPDGTDFVAEAGTFTPGEKIRTGDGMVDILGDSRGVQETVARPDYEQYVRNNPEYMAEVARDNAEREQQGLPPRSLAEWGEAHYARVGEAKGDTLPTSYDQSDSGRQAGFDADGNFLGLSAFSEDLAAGNLSRQRERDLLDVARLSGTYQDIMEDYKPGTQEALADAREVLASQKDNLTGAGAIDIPKDSTFASMGDVKVAGPNKLSASTAFNRQLGLEDGTLRSDILSDAQTALGQGLTSREQDAISEAFKARSTMMGRTFDQSAGIAEAEARVAEDNARRMQNRAFAQSVLGQEAGLQQGDITRGMAQESEQAGLQQQVNLTQADVDMRAALANQAQQQQAGQFQQATTADAQRLNEQLKQSGTLGYIQAASNLAALEDQSTLDPFQAVLGRGGGQSLQAGQSVFGQAGYGLNSGPQYLNPEAGLGFIQNQAVNAANMYGAQVGADAAKTAGLYSAIGSIGGGLLSGSNFLPSGKKAGG